MKSIMEEERNRLPHYEYYEERNRGMDSGSNAPQRMYRRKGRGGFRILTVFAVCLALICGFAAGFALRGLNKEKPDTAAARTALLPETDDSGEIQRVTMQKPAALADALSVTETQEVTAARADKGPVAAVAAATMPSVVAITTVSVQEIRDYFGYGRKRLYEGSGSGILVGENDEEYLIATNNHVVEGAEQLNVFFYGTEIDTSMTESGFYWEDSDLTDKSAVSGIIKGTDSGNDLAVVAVKKADVPEKTRSRIRIVTIGDSEGLVVGEQVVAIGNALGYGQSVTSGWISALDRSIKTSDGETENLIQTDAAINPGNSGGALLNMSGELVGINSAKYADSAVEGMGYAIPINNAVPILEELMNRKTREKLDASESGYLGISMADISQDMMYMYGLPSGAFVIEVFEGYAAYDAGIEKGDIIVKFDGQKVTSTEQLIELLQYYEAGETVDVVISRAYYGKYQEETIQVTMGSRPQ